MNKPETAYLSVCSMYRDHAEYLREWIEFHRLVGVERFFLYDNESTDAHRQVLAPYVERGVVVVHDWPTPSTVEKGVPWGLIAAFDDCLEQHRDDTRWIAFLDVDEFLFSPTGRSLPQVLSEFEEHPGVCVSRVDYGPSGHNDRPSGLVIENYLNRKRHNNTARVRFKSIVDPRRVESCMNAHTFYYRDGAAAVNPHHEAVTGDPPFTRSTISLSPLRINHYKTKSVEEFRSKLTQWESQWAAAGRPVPERSSYEPTPDALEQEYAERDEAITAYVPDLRRALEPS